MHRSEVAASQLASARSKSEGETERVRGDQGRISIFFSVGHSGNKRTMVGNNLLRATRQGADATQFWILKREGFVYDKVRGWGS